MDLWFIHYMMTESNCNLNSEASFPKEKCGEKNLCSFSSIKYFLYLVTYFILALTEQADFEIQKN